MGIVKPEVVRESAYEQESKADNFLDAGKDFLLQEQTKLCLQTMFSFTTYQCSYSSCSTSCLLGVSSHTAATRNKFVNNLLLEAPKNHSSHTPIIRERVSERKSSERKSSQRSTHSDPQGKRQLQDTLRCTGGWRCLELRHGRAGPRAEEGRSSPSEKAAGACTEHKALLADPVLSRQRCLTQLRGSVHIPLRPPASG